MPRPVQITIHATAPEGARAGTLQTPRGVVETPTFMPVATHAHPRNLSFDELKTTDPGIALANTYHLLLRPGLDVFRHFGGIHRFAGWDRTVLTDSGGFQIFSLAGSVEVTEKGASFRSPDDNHMHLLTPELAVEAQRAIGSDIAMLLDVCIASTASREATQAAMERTHRWAVRGREAHAKTSGPPQAQFAIVQGGVFHDLRSQSAEFLTAMDFDGFAVGGLAVGEAREALYTTCAHTAKLLPKDKPRYLMGVGTPSDLIEAVAAGIDMFDCIVPTKMAQQGYAYTFQGIKRVSRSEYRLSDDPLDPECPCPACTQHPLGYLQHLVSGQHGQGGRLLSLHNLFHYRALMARLRAAILAGRFAEEAHALRDAINPRARGARSVMGKRSDTYELVTLESGQRAVRHLGHGEVMHPVGPWEEANRLYPQQTGLARLLSEEGGAPIRVLDVGLGGGANAVAALETAKALGAARRRPLEIVSLEADTTALELAVEDPDGFPFLEPWSAAIHTLLEKGRWSGEGATWTLLRGDAAQTIHNATGPFDLIFHDPFSPEHNGPLWTVSFFTALKTLCAPDAMLATYSAATPARVALLLAGFYVGTGLPTGSRGETTVASLSRTRLSQPLGQRWFDRFKRSSRRTPHGADQPADLEARIVAHPQFAGLVWIKTRSP
jgi:queuine tRNA-ribosyltransferase